MLLAALPHSPVFRFSDRPADKLFPGVGTSRANASSQSEKFLRLAVPYVEHKRFAPPLGVLYRRRNLAKMPGTLAHQLHIITAGERHG